MPRRHTDVVTAHLHGFPVGHLWTSQGTHRFELSNEYRNAPRRPVLGQVFEERPRHRWKQAQRLPEWFSNLLHEHSRLRQLVAEGYGINHRNEFRLPQTGEEPYGSNPVQTGPNGLQAGSKRPTEGDRQQDGDRLRGSRYGRDILTATSTDFVQWTPSVYVNYSEGRPDELYTNQIMPYFRAPHIFLGFPTRYVERPWSESLEALPELAHRRMRAGISERYGTAVTDGMFMSSRDGYNFSLWPESFIRPGLRPRDNWTYGDNFQNWGLVTTPSAMAGAPDELSLFVREGYWRDGASVLRRYTLRVDGFASVQAPLSGGEFMTKPLIFAGGDLVLNFSASAAGSIRVEVLRDQMNTPVEGFSLEDCVEVLGDELARVVRWKDGRTLSGLAGTPIRLRFVLRDADLFSFRFRE